MRVSLFRKMQHAKVARERRIGVAQQESLNED